MQTVLLFWDRVVRSGPGGIVSCSGFVAEFLSGVIGGGGGGGGVGVVGELQKTYELCSLRAVSWRCYCPVWGLLALCAVAL